ncbi:MAG: 2-hydroxyacyl-CoA dehydratase, partial [Bacillota bacterium]
MVEGLRSIPDKATRVLESTKTLGQYMRKQFVEAAEKKREGIPVAWVHLGGVVDILRAFDIACLYPENFCAGCAASGVGPRLIEVATGEWGFDRDLCSYFTMNFGYVAEGRNWQDVKYPSGGLILPDILVGDCLSCVHRVGWWHWINRVLKVPSFIFEGPIMAQWMTSSNMDSHVIEYMVAQLKDLISFLEEHTGQKLDPKRLRQAVAASAESTRLAHELATLCGETIPCPAGVEDFAYWLAGVGALRGHADGISFLKTVKAEVEERVARGQGVLENEKYRIYCSGNLPYYALGMLNYIHRYGGVFVGDWIYRCFCNPEVELDPDNPLESLAKHYLGYALNISYDKHWAYHAKAI